MCGCSVHAQDGKDFQRCALFVLCVCVCVHRRQNSRRKAYDRLERIRSNLDRSLPGGAWPSSALCQGEILTAATGGLWQAASSPNLCLPYARRACQSRRWQYAACHKHLVAGNRSHTPKSTKHNQVLRANPKESYLLAFACRDSGALDARLAALLDILWKPVVVEILALLSFFDRRLTWWCASVRC